MARICEKAVEVEIPTDNELSQSAFAYSILVRFPALNASVAAYSWGVLVTLGSVEQVLSYDDLQKGHIVSPGIEQLQQAMYRDRLEIKEMSFGKDLGAWDYVKAPGIVLAFLWTIVCDFSSSRSP